MNKSPVKSINVKAELTKLQHPCEPVQRISGLEDGWEERVHSENKFLSSFDHGHVVLTCVLYFVLYEKRRSYFCFFAPCSESQ